MTRGKNPHQISHESHEISHQIFHKIWGFPARHGGTPFVIIHSWEVPRGWPLKETSMSRQPEAASFPSSAAPPEGPMLARQEDLQDQLAALAPGMQPPGNSMFSTTEIYPVAVCLCMYMVDIYVYVSYMMIYVSYMMIHVSYMMIYDDI